MVTIEHRLPPMVYDVEDAEVASMANLDLRYEALPV